MGKFFVPLSLALVVLSSQAAIALTGANTIGFKTFDNEHQIQLRHRFRATTAQPKSLHPGFRLFQEGKSSFRDSVRDFIYEKGLHPFLGVTRQSASSADATFLVEGRTRETWSFHLNGVPVCEGEATIQRLSNGTFSVSGAFPDLDVTTLPNYEPVPHQDIIGIITDEIPMGDHVSVHESQPCIANLHGEAAPGLRVRVQVGDLPYLAILANNRLLNWRPMFFSATALTKVFQKNPVDGTVIYAAIKNMAGDGTLQSSTIEMNTNDAAKAEACDQRFLYEPTDVRFQEASAFTHATQMLDWYTSELGYVWDSKKRLRVNIHEQFSDGAGGFTENNALYLPPESTSTRQPTIRIGDGDGFVLRNLPYDSDVVSHEFGHHIVYQYVTQVSGESLIIHEGLADLFTFARTGDACLAESICPSSSAACYSPGTCLRTAENDLEYDASSISSKAPHIMGQIVSGLLWDLHDAYGMPLDVVAELTYKTISLLSTTTSFDELMNALIDADEQYFDGQYCNDIFQSAYKRNLLSFIQDTDCSDPISLREGLNLVEESLVSENSEYLANVTTSLNDITQEITNSCVTTPDVEDDIFTKCGTVGPSSSNSWAWLLLCPLFLALSAMIMPVVKRK